MVGIYLASCRFGVRKDKAHQWSPLGHVLFDLQKDKQLSVASLDQISHTFHMLGNAISLLLTSSPIVINPPHLHWIITNSYVLRDTLYGECLSKAQSIPW